MPSPDEIVSGLSRIVGRWPALAVLWHVYLGFLLVKILTGARPTNRTLGALLAVPLFSVSALAWHESNIFNGTVFAVIATLLLLLAVRLDNTRARTAPGGFLVAGSLLFAFGWAYPHFLDPDTFLTYLYAAPTGLIPCPTLSAVGGLTLVLGGLSSVAWPLILGTASLFYGVYGAAVLGVSIDVVLAAGAACLLVQGLLQWRHASRSRARPLGPS